MTRPYVVNAFFDDEVKIWVGLSDDIPGLALETGTIVELDELAQELGRELVQSNLSPSRRAEFQDRIEIRIIPMPAED